MPLQEESITGTVQSTFSSITLWSGRMKYGLLPAGQKKTAPLLHAPTDKTAGISSRMYRVKFVCRAPTVTSATSSARVEPLAVARQMGVSLTRRLVACVFSIPSLMISCSLPVSTSQTHSFGAGVATVGKWVLLTLLLGSMHGLQKKAGDTAFVVCTENGMRVADACQRAWLPGAGGQRPGHHGWPKDQF